MLSSLLLALSAICVALCISIASLRQINEGDMEWRSFIFGKTAFLVMEKTFPANNTASIQLERTKANLLTTYVLFPLDKLFRPEIGKVPFEDVRIPVAPQKDAMTQEMQDSILIRIYIPSPASPACDQY